MIDFFGRQAWAELEKIEGKYKDKIIISEPLFNRLCSLTERYEQLVDAGLRDLMIYKKLFPADTFDNELVTLCPATAKLLWSTQSYIDEKGLMGL